MPVSQYPQITSFLEFLKFEKRFSKNTVVSYQTDLTQFFAFLQSQYEAPAIKEISTGMVRSWLAELKGEDISAKSINRKISSLRSFYKFLLRNKLVEKSPMTIIIAQKVGKRLPAFVSEVEVEALKNVIEFPETFKGLTDKLILELLYNTGMRLSELINLKESQLDLNNRQIKVLGKGNKERIIPVSAEVVKSLEAYLVEKQKHLHGNLSTTVLVNEKGKSLYPKYVYLVVKQNLSLVTTMKKKSPHILRHTFATHLMNNGADLNAVKELLGHSSLAATQVYTHNTIEKLKDIHKLAHPKA